jgi:penicillin-binding protein 1A
VHQVLLNMVDAGYLKKKEVEPTIANYAKQPEQEVQGGDVRYYTDWIVDTIPTLVGQINDDMIVTTTLDTKMQTQAQDALLNVISMQGEKKNVSQGAVVSMKPDGAVQALVGGLSYAKSQFNRASQAKRQPGSVFKLFVYLAALEAGLTPQSMVEDAPISLQVGNKVWTPENFGMDYKGQIPMVEAIRFSLNTVSVRLSQYTGVEKVADLAMRLGIPNVPAHASIALGSVEATLLEMTGAYAHLPNGGKKVEPYGITSIRTRDGKEIYKREEKEPDTVLAKGTVEMMNYMLLDVVARGTAVKAGLPGRQVAGKTGTSQDFKDAWFIGFTPQLVTGVWIGNDNNKSMHKVTGGSLPATIWHDFMIRAMESKPSKAIPNSAGSSEGLLPWLFGGENTNGENPAATGDVPNAPTVIPEDAPFETKQMGQPADAAPDDVPVEHPAPAKPDQSEGEVVLTPQFWDKLMDGNVAQKHQ